MSRTAGPGADPTVTATSPSMRLEATAMLHRRTVIGGSNTGLNQPLGIALDSSGKLFVANNETQPCSTQCGSVTVYPAGSNGNIRPSVTIVGGNTGLYFPSGIALGASGNIYVANDWGEPDGIG